MVTEILLGMILILLVLLIILFLKGEAARNVESAIIEAWKGLRLDVTLGELATYAKDIRNDYKTLETMLRVPKERGALGEIALETILSDQLPPDMFGIRRKTLDGKIPDAYIRSTVGIICIDSKFPLDNYRRMMEATTPEEKKKLRNQFIMDVQGHLSKIAEDYVCPEKGSAEFAFAFIPSEGVYWFLVTEALDLLRDYTKRGVQVVSPLTLSHKIELIKAGVHAKKLSEEAKRVRDEILKLSRRFEEIDERWRTFYDTHLKNLTSKAEEIDSAYKQLRKEFDKIAHLSG